MAMFPLGYPIPHDRHAVSASMPTWDDVVGYEEGRPAVIEALQCGYPRFLIHPKVREAFALAHRDNCASSEVCFLFFGARAAAACAAYAGGRVFAWRDGISGVAIAKEDRALGQAFWQHAGLGISSRRAEALLAGRAPAPAGDAARDVREALAALAGVDPDYVWLSPTGMASVMLAHDAVTARRPQEKTCQFGFPFVDSLKLQQKFGTGVTMAPRVDAAGWSEVAQLLAGRAAGVFCEIPTNPLLECIDLPRLGKLTREHDTALVVDQSMGGLANIDALPHADMVLASLTKYPVGSGNVMGGVLIVNPGSRHAAAFQETIRRSWEDTVFAEDMHVIRNGLRDFAVRMKRISETTESLCDVLRKHACIERLYYPKFGGADAYDKVKKPGAGYGGVFSLVLEGGEKAAQRFYDALQIAKGPSFGMNQSLACPYTLLAHFDELDWAESVGISRNLIRVSVGLEGLAELQATFEAALSS